MPSLHQNQNQNQGYHPATERLLDSDPFDFSLENKQLFRASFIENTLFHYQHHPFTQKLWQHHQWHPEKITTEEDLAQIPTVMVSLLKEHRFCSVPPEEVVLTLTSSGTGGQKTQQLLSAVSLANVKKLAYQIHQSLGMVSPEKYQYLCFTYDPAIAADLGTAFTDELLTQFTGKAEVYYAFEWDEEKKDFFLNTPGVIETLTRYAKSGLPTRILGFPAFLWEILTQHDLTFSLGADSWVQTGGGWKNKAEQEIPKAEFRTQVSRRLGIPIENIRDLFGMVEHGIPYVDCRLGSLHIPNYARVFIRSPHDLSLLKKGERGLIQFLCSYNFSYPAPSLLTTDYGHITDCPCGLGEALVLSGRAGINQHRGCALKALELLK